MPEKEQSGIERWVVFAKTLPPKEETTATNVAFGASLSYLTPEQVHEIIEVARDFLACSKKVINADQNIRNQD